jgi:glutathione S-transferase
MILYGSSLSPFVRKVLAFAHEKGIDLEIRPTGLPQPSAEFLKASPLGKMPALADGDFTLADSSAIIHYLEAKQPEPSLIPSDPRQRGRTIWFEEFGDTMICACVGKLFFNRVVAPLFMKRDGDLAEADRCEREDLPRVLDYLEKVVPEPGRFLVDDRLTLADIAIAAPFPNLRQAGCVIDEARYGRTLAYADSILARPGFSRWVEQEEQLLRQLRGQAA